jgi:hypothetical protein
MSLLDTYSDLSELSCEKSHAFLSLLKNHFNLSEFIPEPFRAKYYNWLGRDRSISLDIRFYGSPELQSALPDTIDLNSPEDAKNQSDNASLRPLLESFSRHHDVTQFDTFLADSEFDSYDNYSYLKSLGFKKVLIPLNPRNTNPQNSNRNPL